MQKYFKQNIITFFDHHIFDYDNEITTCCYIYHSFFKFTRPKNYDFMHERAASG